MEGQMVTAQDIFLFQQRGIDANGKVVGSMEATGIRPRFAEKFDEYEIGAEERSLRNAEQATTVELNQDVLILAGVGLTVFGGIVALALAISSALGSDSKRARERVDRFADGPDHRSAKIQEGATEILKTETLSGIDSLEGLLQRTSLADRVALELSQADLRLKVSEYYLSRLVISIAAVAVIFWINGPLLALPVGSVGFFAPKFWMSMRRRRRLNALNDQLVDMLALLSNGLKVGYGLTQAIDNASRELPDPLASELKKIVNDINLGINAEVALLNFMERAKSYDLELIVSSMLIQRKTGGNLSEVLENISHTIRERIQIQGEIRTLTAEGRLSGYVLTAMPFILVGGLQLLNPTYIGGLFETTVGRLMLGGALLLVGVGILLIRMITNVKI